MKLIYTIMFVFLSGTCLCQQKERIGLPDHKIDTNSYISIKKFIPADYIVMDQADGDLNGDGVIDKILILRLKHEMTEEEKRPVLLLIRQQDHSFKKVAENDNIILSLGDGGIHGDPYHGITIKNGYFSLEHFGGSGWRWNQVITFKYNKRAKNWYLHKVGDQDWHFDPSKDFKSSVQTKVNFGKVPFNSYKNKWRDKE